MTGPQDPFAKPPSGAPEPGGAPPPEYGAQPQGYGAPPQQGYGAPPQQGYGAPTGYEQPSGGYGAPGRPPLAEWGTRVAAFLIDLAIVFGIIIVAVILAAILGSVSSALGVLVGIAGYLGAFGFFFWQLVVQGQTGQTIGKKQMKIKLLREQDGQVVGAGLSIGRYFVHIVDSLPLYIGYLWPLWDAKKQTFADKILQTVVVKV